MKKIFNLSILLLCLLMVFSCKDGPKIITASVGTEDGHNHLAASNIFSDKDAAPSSENSMAEELHIVQTLETLEADRYVYVKVREEEKEYWVATAKKDITLNEIYFFKKGLEKSNFKSEELDRTFDYLMLVSNLVPADHGGSKIQKLPDNTATVSSGESKGQNIQVDGSTSISEIVNNPEKYKNKEVTISGKCTKVNFNIMGRNWIHLKDGSKDDFDFVVTSGDEVKVGEKVTMKGAVHLDVDFGAGYAYDIIMEDAKVLQKN